MSRVNTRLDIAKRIFCNLDKPLHDHQIEGIRCMMALEAKNSGGLLCDDPGLGKTYQILSLVATDNKVAGSYGSTLVILPKSILTKSLEINKNEKLIFKKINLNDIDKKFDFNKYSFKLPFKNFNYFKKRFFDHPIYSYDIYGVFDKSKLLSILVIRINEYKNSTCMRVIDFYGEESTLSNFTWHLLQIMHSAGHEYIDLFTKGLDKKIIAKAGFIKVNNKKSDMVIPNYFEPFVQCNITIRYFTDAIELKNLRIYKGDGDQDRPNFITTGD